MHWKKDSQSEEFEPISWPIRVASAFVLPLASLLLLALPLGIVYSFQYLNYDSESPAVVVSMDENEEGDCTSEIRFEANGTLYASRGDCLQKTLGEELTVKYYADDPKKNTSKGPWFALLVVPLVGFLLTTLGVYIISNCFYFYRELILEQIERKNRKEAELRMETEDSLHGDYHEDTWEEEHRD